MNILVTGAGGFVGSVLIPRLLERFPKHPVTAMLLPGEPVPAVWTARPVTILRGDITRREDSLAACRGKSHIIHLAAVISYWRGDLKRSWAINVRGVEHMIEGALAAGCQRFVHISSVGAVGFHRGGRLADETTPFNWPSSLTYMLTKYEGQKRVEQAVEAGKLPALILNPASIMGPGDARPSTPHNRVYRTIYNGTPVGSFSGGLAVVDVRDLVEIIIKSLHRGRIGERYLVVGANVTYQEVIRRIGHHARRRVYPVRIPALLLAGAGFILESLSRLSGKQPFLTQAYGRLSGWYAYYSNRKSMLEFNHRYREFDRTIEDGCRYFEETFPRR